MRKRRGFTLIEVLLVIMIISIIFTAMGINITSLQNEARASKAVADLKLLQLAIESYYKNYMYQYPPVDGYQSELLDAIPRILEQNLFDPFGVSIASFYVYSLSPNMDYYVAYSLGIGGHGSAFVGDDGGLRSSGGAICITNGRR